MVSEGYMATKGFRAIISGFPPLLIYAEPPIVIIKFLPKVTSFQPGTYKPGYFFTCSSFPLCLRMLLMYLVGRSLDTFICMRTNNNFQR
jgi:hypothetical protein